MSDDTEKRVRIVIEGQDDGAKSVLDSVGDGLKGILEVAGGIELAKVFDEIATGVTEVFNSAAEEQDIMTLLSQGVDHLGASAAMTLPEMVNLANGIGQTTQFSHDLVLQGENILMRFTAIGHDTFPQVTQAATDMAAATGVNLTSAMQLLGRTLEDPAAGMATLRRYNIVLTDAQKESIKTMEAQGDVMGAQKVILNAIEGAYGGAAQAMGGTITGQQAIFQNNMQTISETLGGALLPLLTSFNTILGSLASNPQVVTFFDNLGVQAGKLLDPLTHLVNEFTMIFGSGNDQATQIKMILDALTNLNPVLGSVATGAVNFGTAISGAFSGGGLSGVISMLTGGALDTGVANLKSFFSGDWSGPLAATQASLAKWLETQKEVFTDISNFVQAKVMPFLVEEFNTFTTWLNDNKPLIQSFIIVINQMYQEIQAGIQWLVPQLLGLWAVIQPLLSGIIDLVLNLVKLVMQAFTGDWAGVWETAKATVVGAAQAIWTAVVALLNWIAGLFGGSLAQIGTTWTGVWNAMLETVGLVIGRITSYWANFWATFTAGFNTDIDTFKTTVSNIGTALYTIGQNVIQGLWNGLENVWSGVKTWWQNEVLNFLNTAKAVLGIHSPSSEFFEIGQQIVNGLVGGIGQNIQVPVNMIGNMGQSMIGAMSGASNTNTATTVYMTNNIQSTDPKKVVDELMQTFQLQGIRFNRATG